MASTDVAMLAEELARAVELTMSASASQTARHEAYNACERFKETSPLCAQAGLYLAASSQNSTVVRHFGLQLMEHTVKYRWTQISQQEKLFIKENAMKLLCSGGVGDESHMKDALSRVVVEMVKREWPQQWSTLLAELSEACGCGEAQTELVLLIFLRLVEDVALLQTLESNQRRKDIYQALTTNMSVIFEFFLRLIELHVGEFRRCGACGDARKAGSHGRVVQVVLLTLAGFVEWVSMSHIVAREGRLLQILCLLLTDACFQCAAAECLLQIVSRKGRVEERKPLLVLLGDEAARCLLAAAESDGVGEQHYLFKKKLIQVLTGLGSQLCALWGKDGGISARPPNLNAFLDAMLTFSAHPSLTLAHLANPLWSSMLKHEHVSRDPVFLSYVPRWLQATAAKIVRVQYPGDAFVRLDYDSEDEFALFFYRCRTDLLESLRQATVVAPLVTFGYVEQWLVRCLSLASDSPEPLSHQDPLYLEWEALANVCDSVLSRLLQASERPPPAAGLRLLELCLAYDARDPLLLSTLLTCISALFVFLSMSSGQVVGAPNAGAALLPRVLDKIFGVLGASPLGVEGQTRDGRSRAVKNVRRHAASLMVKIGHKYPLLLLPVFDQMRATVGRLHQQTGPSQLSTLERVTLDEALLLVSNHLCDYERQSAFVAELLQEAARHWQRIAQEGAFEDASRFASFVGLDRPSALSDDPCGNNRSHVVLCVNLLLGAVKRCAWPDDPERAARGGFVVGLTEAGNPVCRNPATPHVVPLLPHLLDLARVFNELHSPENRSRLAPDHSGCLNMLDVERANLLGLAGASQPPSSLPQQQQQQQQDPSGGCTRAERVQRFLMYLHESCYHLLGAAGPSLGRDLYQLQGLGDAVVRSVLSGLPAVPDYRLRPVVRVFLKPFVHACPPPFYEPVLLPVLAHLAPLVHLRLETKWQRLRDANRTDDTGTEEDILDDILTRALTRDYLDVLRVALIGGGLADAPPDGDLDLAMDAAPVRSSAAAAAADVISELGAILLRTEATCKPLVFTVLGALAWIDSNASFKATLLVGPIVRLLVADGSLSGATAGHVMLAVLQALSLHGQHEANQGSLLALGAQLYETLRPLFPDVLFVMQQIPCVNPADLHKLDERISASANATKTTNKVDKVKKDLFKKIIGPLIGRSIGQLFRKEVKIADLPRIQLPNKPKQPDVVPDLTSMFR